MKDGRDGRRFFLTKKLVHDTIARHHPRLEKIKGVAAYGARCDIIAFNNNTAHNNDLQFDWITWRTGSADSLYRGNSKHSIMCPEVDE